MVGRGEAGTTGPTECRRGTRPAHCDPTALERVSAGGGRRGATRAKASSRRRPMPAALGSEHARGRGRRREERPNERRRFLRSSAPRGERCPSSTGRRASGAGSDRPVDFRKRHHVAPPPNAPCKVRSPFPRKLGRARPPAAPQRAAMTRGISPAPVMCGTVARGRVARAPLQAFQVCTPAAKAPARDRAVRSRRRFRQFGRARRGHPQVRCVVSEHFSHPVRSCVSAGHVPIWAGRLVSSRSAGNVNSLRARHSLERPAPGGPAQGALVPQRARHPGIRRAKG
jgi:hypothetical protein